MPPCAAAREAARMVRGGDAIMAGRRETRAGRPQRLCGAATALVAAMAAPGCNKVQPAIVTAPAEVAPLRVTTAVAQTRAAAVRGAPAPFPLEPRGAAYADPGATADALDPLAGPAQTTAMASAEAPLSSVPDEPPPLLKVAKPPRPTTFAASHTSISAGGSAPAIAGPADLTGAKPGEATEVAGRPATGAPAANFDIAISSAATYVEDLPSTGSADIASAATAQDTSQAYISQISDEVRAAYIAQVDGASSASRLAVRSGDTVLGAVEFQVADGAVSVRIGQILDLFESGMEQARFAELRQSEASQQFVSLERIQAAGIPLEYNAAYVELTLDRVRG